jgi:hypothetical protein
MRLTPEFKFMSIPGSSPFLSIFVDGIEKEMMQEPYVSWDMGVKAMVCL